LPLYETTFITGSQLEDSELDKEIRAVQDLITANGGNIVETQRWGMRRFAYEIKRQKQGNYTHILYEAAPSVPASLVAAFKVNERILRYLTVRSIADLEAIKARQEPQQAAEAAPEREQAPATEAETAAQPEERTSEEPLPEAPAESDKEALEQLDEEQNRQ
jgi:small subunit ribosomal protein S6